MQLTTEYTEGTEIEPALSEQNNRGLSGSASRRGQVALRPQAQPHGIFISGCVQSVVKRH
jgi:hypothetical protein